MNASTKHGWHAASLVIAPAVMIAGFALHPHIGSPVDADFVARLATAVLADPTRWAIAHLLVAVGSGLLMLAFLSLRALLREAREDRWSAIGVPFIVMGSTLYALLPAMEFAPLATARAGADHATVQAVQTALFTWFGPNLLAGAVVFAIGVGCFAAGLVRSGLLGRRQTRMVVAALVVFAAARFVPFSLVQFHVHGVAGALAFWSVAYAILSRGGRATPAGARTAA